MNRLDRVLYKANGSPEYNMKVMMRELQGTIVPEPNKYYVFVYKAKTPNIQYDKHPLIACTGVYKWGFTGFNYHWEDYRRYSWLEVISNVFEVKQEELETAQNFKIAKIKST
jgi:hypothetical protein